MTTKHVTNVMTVRRAWGAAAAEWLIVLGEICDRTSQSAVARKLGISATAINQVLRGSYRGRLDRIEQRVRGELMRECVMCPILGEVTRRRCLDEQSRPYAATNALRVELRRACPRCPHQMKRSA